MDDLLRFKVFNGLKTINRMNSVGNRKESSAEHSWSALMLADYFMEKCDMEIDKLKVYELLMYHDVVEIESGDIALDPSSPAQHKGNELESANKLSKMLPVYQGQKFIKLYAEFAECRTLESRFANAIDKFDAIIQELDHKKDWKGWSKRFLIEKKEKFFLDFPIIHKKFLDMIEYLDRNGYFNQ